MFKTDNSLHVFAGGVFEDGKTASSAAAGTIWVEDETGANHTDVLTAGEYFRVCQMGPNNVVKKSPLVNKDDIIKATGVVYDAASSQSTTFGSNGSTGSIDNVNSNRYTIRVNFKNNDEMFSEQSDLHFFEYVSDASATEVEIVDYFAQVMSKNEKFNGKTYGNKRACSLVQRYSDGTSAALGAGTITFYSGSKYALASSGSHGLTAGEYVRVGHATTATNPVYKVESVSSTAIYLDQPYQGADNPTATCGQMTAAQAAAGSWGIKMTGVTQEWVLGLKTWDVVTFDVNLDGWGSTTAVSTTAGDIGSGEGEQVAELEWFGNGSAGAPYRHGVANNADLITAYADSSLTYGVISLDCKLSNPNYAVAGAGVGRCQIVIACKVGVVDEADGAALQANTIFGVTGHSSS